jgi:hypothetical protein
VKLQWAIGGEKVNPLSWSTGVQPVYSSATNTVRTTH